MMPLCYDSFLFNSIHEADLIKMLAGYKFKTVLDIGAHCGLWTRALAKISDHVIAVEPHPAAYAELVKNMATYPNVTCVNMAAWNETGMLEMQTYLNPSHSTCNSVHPRLSTVQGKESPRTIVIDAVKLDALLFSECYPIDFVKIDVEGAEIQVMTGASKTFLNPNIRYMIECHTDQSFHVISSVLPNGRQANYGSQKYWTNL